MRIFIVLSRSFGFLIDCAHVVAASGSAKTSRFANELTARSRSGPGSSVPSHSEASRRVRMRPFVDEPGNRVKPSGHGIDLMEHTDSVGEMALGRPTRNDSRIERVP